MPLPAKDDYLGRAKEIVKQPVGVGTEIRLVGLVLLDIAQTLRHIAAHYCEKEAWVGGPPPEGWECNYKEKP